MSEKTASAIEKPRTVKELTLAELRARIVEAAMFASRAVAFGKEAQAEIQSRLEAEAKQLMSQKAKTSGEATLEKDGEKYKVEISKTVSWDNSQLQAIAAGMDWPTAQRVFKIDLGVPEAIFKASEATNPELFTKLQGARTVKYGDLVVKPIFEKEKS